MKENEMNCYQFLAFLLITKVHSESRGTVFGLNRKWETYGTLR